MQASSLRPYHSPGIIADGPGSPPTRRPLMLGRRAFLLTLTTLGAAGVAGRAHAQSAPVPRHTGGISMKTGYDPAATLDLKVSEVELRRTASGRVLMARVYQPQGIGPFPTLLD